MAVEKQQRQLRRSAGMWREPEAIVAAVLLGLTVLFQFAEGEVRALETYDGLIRTLHACLNAIWRAVQEALL